MRNDMAMMLWCLWCHCNDKVWKGDLKPIDMVVQIAREVHAKWQETNDTSATPAQRQQ